MNDDRMINWMYTAVVLCAIGFTALVVAAILRWVI